MYDESKHKTIVLRIKPFVWWHGSLPSPSWAMPRTTWIEKDETESGTKLQICDRN